MDDRLRGEEGRQIGCGGLTLSRIPGINHLDAVRALEKAGFRVVRQSKHIVTSDGTRIPTIPPLLAS